MKVYILIERECYDYEGCSDSIEDVFDNSEQARDAKKEMNEKYGKSGNPSREYFIEERVVSNTK